MKVLVLTRYSRLGASSRLRMMQYISYLEGQGLTIDVSPLLDDGYLRCLYTGRQTSRMGLARAYLDRTRKLFGANRFDLVWIEKELFPMFPSAAERLLRLCGIPFIVDYDDAIFHNYDRSHNRWVRHVLGKKIDNVMRNASAVVAGNEYLAARATVAGSKIIEIIPTVVDLDYYSLQSIPSTGTFTIGWIGTPKTAKYLELVQGALREVSELGGVTVKLVGAGPVKMEGVAIQSVDWNESSEVHDIFSFDVGIMPLPDSPWERGKCGYKLIQYMACGKPVVASPVGANKKIVSHAENGFLAEDHSQWVRALKSLKDSRALRSTMGASARKTVEQQYCLEITAPRLLGLMQSVVSRGA